VRLFSRREPYCWLGIVFMAFSISACVRVDRRPAVFEGAWATLALSFERSVYRRGDKVNVTIELRNVASRYLWVRESMSLSSRHDPVSKIVWLKVIDPDGREIPFGCKSQGRPSTTNKYRILKPGETIHTSDNLGWCYDLNKTGFYRLKAYYKDDNKRVSRTPMGASVLYGLLQSKMETIEITE
jgi:hypothetical protein